MPTTPLAIRPPTAADQPAWRTLYNGYATFYRRDMTDQIAANVWGWLHDPAHELEGLLAFRGDSAIGLAHYRRMPSPLRGADVGFLDDLFVTPEARGTKAAEQLLAHLADIARARNWGLVRWITADDNYRARGLYDRVAQKTMWNLYEMPV